MRPPLKEMSLAYLCELGLLKNEDQETLGTLKQVEITRASLSPCCRRPVLIADFSEARIVRCTKCATTVDILYKKKRIEYVTDPVEKAERRFKAHGILSVGYFEETT